MTTATMRQKSVTILPSKADDPEGYLRAVFATFNVVDKDGDVTLPGAFQDGAIVRLTPWQHNIGQPTIGVGRIVTDQSRALFEGQFNLAMQSARDTYESVKFNGDLQEYSYEFNVVEGEPGKRDGQDVFFLKRVEVFGVSPVYRGAGVNTGTDRIKATPDTELDALAALVVELKEGRELSARNRAMLRRHLETIRDISSDIEKLLQDTDPDKGKAERAAALREFVARNNPGFEQLIAAGG